MLIGFVALVIGFANGGGPVVIVGLIVCGLGVIEVTGREHFTGYRSHTTLLAAAPAVVLEVIVVAIFGEPDPAGAAARVRRPGVRGPVLGAAKAFATARQARVARAARPERR